MSSDATIHTPFDDLASTYAEQWSQQANGRAQREQVWRHMETLFKPGDRILDLGCGIGDDALHFSSRGVEVLGIDASKQMVDTARLNGVAAEHGSIEDLGPMLAKYPAFAGAISNFGAFNCVEDLDSAARHISSAIQFGGPLAICVLSRFSWRESAKFLASGDFKRTMRRWSGQTQWRGMTIYYRSGREIVTAFAPYFKLTKRVSIGQGDHQLYIFQRRLA